MDFTERNASNMSIFKTGLIINNYVKTSLNKICSTDNNNKHTHLNNTIVFRMA